MKPQWSAGIPALLQGGIALADEYFYHRKRGLNRWEKVGHPLDTLTVVLPLVLAGISPPTRTALKIFTGLAAFSTLFVTKDEEVHARECTAGEHRLHAFLYSVHPLFFVGWQELWKASEKNPQLKKLLGAEVAALAAFLAYQAVEIKKRSGGGRSAFQGKGGREGGGAQAPGGHLRRTIWRRSRSLR